MFLYYSTLFCLLSIVVCFVYCVNKLLNVSRFQSLNKKNVLKNVKSKHKLSFIFVFFSRIFLFVSSKYRFRSYQYFLAEFEMCLIKSFNLNFNIFKAVVFVLVIFREKIESLFTDWLEQGLLNWGPRTVVVFE